MYGNQITLFCLQFNDIVETLAVKDEESEGKISFNFHLLKTQDAGFFVLVIAGIFTHSSR